MTIQLSVPVRNARADAWETTIGDSALLRIYSGDAPANCAATESGTLLVEYDLASDWAAAADSGEKELNDLPLSVTGADAAGDGTDAGHFRIYDSAGTTCGMQGTVTATGGGGDMQLDNVSIAKDQKVNITSFALTEGGA